MAVMSISRADFKQEDFEVEDQDLLEYISDEEVEVDASSQRKLDESHPRSVICLGTPKADEAKVEKLKTLLTNTFNQVGNVEELILPMNPSTSKTYGCAFVTFESEQIAKKAVQEVNGAALGKNVLRVLMVDDAMSRLHQPEEFQESDIAAPAASNRADEREWLLDSLKREQILVRYQDETKVFWHDVNETAPVLCYGGEREKIEKKVWCDSKVQWSCWGSYLCTFHKQGIVTWSGPEFTKKTRFLAPNVRWIDFSPNEEFMITWNGADARDGGKEDVKIFDLRSGELKRAFPAPEKGVFKWSPDGQFFCKMDSAQITVYSTEDFMVLKNPAGKRQAIKFGTVEKFQWSPKDNIVAVWSPETEGSNQPARLTMVELPSRKEVAVKSFFSIKEAQMVWQSEGDFMCLMVSRIGQGKQKKVGLNNLEIFRMREKNIPVDNIEVAGVVRSVEWEPRSNRFAVIRTSDDGKEHSVLFYQVGAKAELVYSLDLHKMTGYPQNNNFTRITWSPLGKSFVLAAIGHGDLMFCTLTEKNRFEMFHKDEHFLVTDVQWDPSSRYVITSVCQPRSGAQASRYMSEASYAIWTFQGRQAYKLQKERLWQVVWRPHPPSLLAADKVKDIHKNFREYAKKYDVMDDANKDVQRKAIVEKRHEQLTAFLAVIAAVSNVRDALYADGSFGDSVKKFQSSCAFELVENTTETEVARVEEIIS